MTAYAQQFATVYLAVGGQQRPLRRAEAIAYLKPLLGESFRAGWLPRIQTLSVSLEGPDEFGFYRIAGGPFEGRDLTEPVRYLTALKWNVQSRDGSRVTSAALGQLRAHFRSTRRSLASEGFSVLNWSLQPYGEPLMGDRGVPATPGLPPRPVEASRADTPSSKRFPWGLVATLVAGLALAGAKGA